MNFLIRADGSETIGSGHVMRCFALAEELFNYGHKVVFCYAQMLPGLRDKIIKLGGELIEIITEIGGDDDLAQTRAVSNKLDISAIILDGYEFEENYVSGLHEMQKLIFLDDYARLKNISADIVINSSPAAFKMPYATIASKANLLLGPEYVLIRNEFRSKRGDILPLEERKNILVTFGGTDPAGLTVPIVKNLLKYFDENQTIDIVVSSDIEFNFPAQVEIHKDCNYMAQLMARCGYAISAGGNTINELAVMQIPTLLVVVADNQENHAKWAKKNGTNIVVDARLKDKNSIAEEIVRSSIEIINDIGLKVRLCAKNKLLVGGDGVTKIVSEISRLFSNNQQKSWMESDVE